MSDEYEELFKKWGFDLDLDGVLQKATDWGWPPIDYTHRLMLLLRDLVQEQRARIRELEMQRNALTGATRMALAQMDVSNLRYSIAYGLIRDILRKNAPDPQES
jgi:hypothetical protein